MTGLPAASRHIGVYADVAIDLVAWDAVTAEVDLSFACLFEREIGDRGLVGGLNDLNQAMQGRLLSLRSDGVFRGTAMETLHITAPPARVRGESLMLVGLGDPLEFTPLVMEQAARLAVGEAIRLQAKRAALAPGMLDSGLTAAATEGAGEAMLAGVTGALDAQAALEDAGMTQRHTLTRWVFDVGAAHLNAAANDFQQTFARRWGA